MTKWLAFWSCNGSYERNWYANVQEDYGNALEAESKFKEIQKKKLDNDNYDHYTDEKAEKVMSPSR